MQKALKYSYIFSYILKPSHLITQIFDNNRTSQEKIFKHMYNFGAQAEWREGRRVVGSYLYFETIKDKCQLLNPTPLEYIAGYIM